MAKYQKYEEYKDSGVEWLDVIPSHWVMSKIKYIAPFQVGWTPPTGNDSNFIGENIWANISDLRGKIITDTVKRISDKAAKEASMDITPKGSLLYSFKLSVGSVSFAGRDMYTNEAIASFTSDSLLPLEYLYYVLPKFLIENASTNIYGARILNQELIRNAIILKPTYEEAKTIANFLDYQTAQIDTLIDKQQTLIQLLKEKRQAVISHAVTKGLNPDAPMKDSGVKWLGEVPEHWQVKRIKHYGKIMGGFAFKSDDFIDSGYPVLKISNVSHLQLNFDDESFLPLSFVEKHLEYKVEENDLVFAMTRPIISGGIKVAKIPKLEAMPLVNQRVGFLKLKSELLADFILYSSLNSSFKAQFKNNMTITNQPNISGEGIESVALPMPPKNELVEIVDFLNNSETVFQNLSIKSEQQVELLKERRTALISAAVTGKIDVRGWRASN